MKYRPATFITAMRMHTVNALNTPLTEGQRHWMLKVMWAGVPLSLLHLAGQFMALPEPLDILPGCLTAGFMIGGLFGTRHDEFVARKFDRASQIALAVAGMMMIAGFPVLGPLLIIDTGVSLAVIGVAFNLAFAVLRLGSE